MTRKIGLKNLKTGEITEVDAAEFNRRADIIEALLGTGPMRDSHHDNLDPDEEDDEDGEAEYEALVKETEKK